jgi:class 3 adenylate cyclase/tetratricopeptide (TPR) repeat protein
VPVCPNCREENPERARFCLSCGTALAVLSAPPREVRKTVTVLFCDVTGSTGMGERLDPESLRRVMSRYFQTMRGVLERHGGIVEKFIGDAVMAVFGIPQLHEDDALRAVRAAIEMREALAGLNEELDQSWGIRIENRTGVNTGEVVAGDPGARQTLVTGDAVNVAARLEQAANPGEILIGEETRRLVRDAVDLERLDPLTLKGKSEPVAAHRLLAVRPGAPGFARHLGSPLVGRTRECLLLQQAFERSAVERSCLLFTVLGPVGVGKSRLIEELLRLVEAESTVLRGRCLPYGEGITFWPIREVVKQASGFEDTDRPEDARKQIEHLLTGDADAPVIAARVAEALGLAEGGAVQEEIFWGIRKLPEYLARSRPLVVLFDDIHWADPTFLDLIEHIADWSRDSPILLLCPARLELLDHRPTWGGGKLNATSILLEPLSDQECGILIENLLGQAGLAQGLAARITNAAEGNPLFVEEMLRMLVDDGLLQRMNSHWEPTGDLSHVPVPATVQAVLAARLDRLQDEERRVIERASVGGKVFYRGAVAELTPEPEREAVGSHLMTLVRRELVRIDGRSFAGQDAFRFRHILIRDAAYESMSKELRAELHERFAQWLARTAGERVIEYEEIIAHHLEEAYRYRGELAPVDERAEALARRAEEWLGRAGRRALDRGDVAAASNLLARAAALLPHNNETRAELLIDLGDALSFLDVRRALDVLSEAQTQAAERGDGRLEAHARVLQLELRITSESKISKDEVLAEVTPLLSTLEGHGDDLGLARAWQVFASVSLMDCQFASMEERVERALLHARRAGDRREETKAVDWLCRSLCYGPTPVKEAAVRLQELLREYADSRAAEQRILMILGTFEAMSGRPDKARDLIARAATMAEDLGDQLSVAFIHGFAASQTEELAGDLLRAEAELRVSQDLFERMGRQGFRSTIAGMLARALYLQGRYQDAEHFVTVCQELASPDDVLAQAQWRAEWAKVLARRGEAEEAEQLAREAVKLVETTDMSDWQGQFYMGLAEVLRLAGRPKEAKAAVEEASGRYGAKGNVVAYQRAREFLAELTYS